MLAEDIANQYAGAIVPQRLQRITSRLVGKLRTSGALDPKPVLFDSRLNDLQGLEARIQRNPGLAERYEEDAARTMLQGGKSKNRKRRHRIRI